MKRIGLFLMIAAVLGFAWGCKEDDNNPQPGTVTLRVKMVDSPAAYDAVNVDVVAMKARIDSTWIDLPVAAPGVYNLLELTNGNSVLLIGDTSLNPGTITELRLILGDNNSVVVDGITHDLTTPSAQSSGYKIKMDPQPMEPGGVYSIVIDFDANRSIHKTGNNKYMLKPCVTGYLENANLTGGISGVILPGNAAWWVEAFNATDTAGTAIDSLTGSFLISPVIPGTYAVRFLANTTYSDTTITGVVVNAGVVTVMDTVVFN